MSLRKTLLAATVLALPLATQAQAQTVTGLYVAGGVGANWHNSDNGNFTVAGFGAPVNMGVETSTGWLALASIGWGFGNGLRLEVEGSYRTNDVDSTSFRANVPTVAWNRSGYISTMALMANVLYDFRLGPVMPYVGAGVGYGWFRYNGVGGTVAPAANPAAASRVSVSQTNGEFAFQGIVGLAYPIPAVPGLAITAEYRYFQTADASFRANASGGAVANFNASNQNNSVLVGVRYNFGQAPRPAPVAAAPAPARSFLVFFDFASDQLTARAREIVGQAAQAARSQQVTRIEVAGHTDTVGSAQYNQGLSIRRANNVAAELVRQGVPRNAITTAGFGFSRPLVPTGPNVREPQNRRVEIVLR